MPSTFRFDEPFLDEPLDNLMLTRAVQDACQFTDLALRHEASAWLWVCCPDVADQLGLNAAESSNVPHLAICYMDRQAVNLF